MWERIIKAVAAGAGAAVSFWTGLGVMPQTLAVVMLVDYVTGLMCAVKGVSLKTESGHVSSKAGFEGLMKKAAIILIVFVATWLDEAIGTQALAAATMCFYIANEGVSILENTSLLGVPYPQVLKNALEAIKEHDDKGATEK